MNRNSGIRTIRGFVFCAGLLTAALAWGQTGNFKNLPDITLTTGNPTATTQTVSASGNGTVKFLLGKPETTPPGACLQLNAQILRNNSPAATQTMTFCNSASQEIQTSHTGSAQYALRLSRVGNNWNTVPIRISALRAFYPTSNTPITLQVPGTLMQLAAGIQQTRNFTVPGPGALMIRLKSAPSVPLLGVLRQGSTERARQQGNTGSVVLNANVSAGGTYTILIQNLDQRRSTQASIDRVEFTPAN